MRNVKLSYLFTGLRSFDICNAIWMLYLVYRGMSLIQVGFIEGVFHIASLMFEVPSGAIADLLGRKTALIIGRISMAISALLMMISNSFWGFALAFVFSALSYNMNSGSDEALLYDSLKQEHKEGKYLIINSRMNVLIEVSIGLSTFVGGIVAQYSYIACYAIAMAIAIVSCVIVGMMEEPKYDKHDKEDGKGKRKSILTQLMECMSTIKKTPKVLYILLFFPMVETFHALVFYYGQEIYSQMGFNRIGVSLVMLASGVASCVGAMLSTSFLKRLGDNMKYAASIAMAICTLIVSFGISGKLSDIVSGGNIGGMVIMACGIVAFAMTGLCMSCLYPVQSSSLNELIESHQRATIISVSSMIYSVGMIVAFPVFAWIVTMIGFNWTLRGLAVLQLALMSGIMACAGDKGLE